MSHTSKEHDIYWLQGIAVNEPLRYSENCIKNTSNLSRYPIEIKNLFLARALLTAGNLKEAMSILDDLHDKILKYDDVLVRGKYYLIRYNIYLNLHTDTAKAEDYYLKACQLTEKTDSKALRCELNIVKSQKTDLDMTFEEKEALLHSAMRDALDIDILDLKLEVHQAFCMMYLVNGLHEAANRELLLLQDLVNCKQNPFLHTNLLNYQGIVHLRLKDPLKAEEILERGLTTAREHSYVVLQIALLINLGVSKDNTGRFDEGILCYQSCMDLAEKHGLEQSLNAFRNLGNLANALGRSGKAKKAIGILNKALETCIHNGRTEQENILRVNLANIMIKGKDPLQAEEHLDKAIACFSNLGNLPYLTNACLGKAMMYEAIGDYHKAYDAMTTLDEVRSSHFCKNFDEQQTRFQKRLDKMRQEYVLIKSQCDTDAELGRLMVNTNLIGEHPSIKKALKDAFMAAGYPYTNVLITGESGTGKEVIARIIHEASKTNKQLVAINASAISANLIESELFGHKRGAFTGALEDRKGKFLMADKGTLLLDEISEMPLDCQVKLLRAIEMHSIQPVGSDKEISVHCRIISTSNRDISSLIHADKFRLDLYHRINKVEIKLLPLRERISDLELITEYYVQHFAKLFRQPEPSIVESFYARLREYRFPGNIRELSNIVERIFILKPSKIWSSDQLEGLITESRKFQAQPDVTLENSIKDAETDSIIAALEKSGWVQKEAAKLLNITESTLSRHIKKLRIRRP